MLRVRRPGLSYPVHEDWHVVGAGGEPAFSTGWSNASASTYPKMAFRLREAGIVDIVGCVTVGPTATGPKIFELPVGYRPINSCGIMPVIRQRSSVNSGQILVVNDTGDVSPFDVTDGDVVYISGSFFLDSVAGIP